MHTPVSISTVSALLVAGAAAKAIPSNLQSLYNSLTAKTATCSNKLASGFYNTDGGGAVASYCGDHLSDYGIVYIQSSKGQLTNVDIDCDGTQHGAGDDGRCGSSGDTQDITSFQSTVAGYKAGINDLNAYVHPYVVFGNDNDGGSSGWPTFKPQSYGIEPLSVVAVVCNNQLIYGIWGDTNGDDGDHPMVGEASLSLATACFGTSMNGDNGYDGLDVLFVAFTGSSAVPGAKGAAWSASNYANFESSISNLGDQLVARIGTSGVPSTTSKPASKTTTTFRTTTSPPTSSPTCDWPGHCLGASCSNDDGCADDLVCVSGACANPTTCSWAGHCAGASCSTDDDCSDDLTCKGGICG